MVGGRHAEVFAETSHHEPPGVTRVGEVADAQLKALYAHALALVFPSLYEGFGLPPLEAMACGCAVAASRAASLPEVCGEAALYFDPLDVDDMVATLQRLCGDGALRAALRKAGTQHVAAYTWAASAAALLDSRTIQDLSGDAA
jgi:glycosyltransferase involved in cell wall biosynthesis